MNNINKEINRVIDTVIDCSKAVVSHEHMSVTKEEVMKKSKKEYAVMNMEHSDHGRVIGKWVDGDAGKYVEFCYDLTISQLTDADRPKFVRGYFGLD